MGVVYFSIIPTFEPSRYCKCWIVCFYNRKKKTQEKPATSSEKVKEQEKDYSGLERIGIFAFGSALFLDAAVLFV